MHSVAPWPGGGACVSSLLVTHASPLPLWRPPGVSGPPPSQLTTESDSVLVHPPQVPEGTHLFATSSNPTVPRPPPRLGSPGPLSSPMQTGRCQGRVTHSARATSAVSSRNCFLRLVHTSFTVCWSRPTCQKQHLHMRTGLGGCLEEEAAVAVAMARLRAGWGRKKHAPESPQGKAPEAGDPGMSSGGMVRNLVDEETSETWFLSPASRVEGALREKLMPNPGVGGQRGGGRQGHASLCSLARQLWRPAEPCPTVYATCRACTHRHIVKFVVRNGLFHQVWLLRGP